MWEKTFCAMRLELRGDHRGLRSVRIDEISRVLEVGARVCDRRHHIIVDYVNLRGRNGGFKTTISGGHDGFACVYQNNLSWSSPTTPLPTEPDPRSCSNACSATEAPRTTAAQNCERTAVSSMCSPKTWRAFSGN